MDESKTTALVVPEAQDARPQYLRGFDGIASEPFPEDVRKVLAEPIVETDVEIKPDGIVFLPGVAWRRILTRAFGAGGWAIAPRGPSRVMGNIVIYHGALYALGRFVGEAVGECFYRESNANMSYASCVEGARTDCIGRVAKDLGYGAEMWDANWREQWKAKYAVSYQGKDRDGKPKTMWKLKNRVSNPHDLMSGAGGVAPSAATPPKMSPTDSPTAAPVASTSAAAPAEGGTASKVGTLESASALVKKAEAAGADPKDEAPATVEAESGPVAGPPIDSSTAPAAESSGDSKGAIRAILGKLKWKKAMVRMEFRRWFGTDVGNAENPIDILDEKQAEAAYLLLGVFGKVDATRALEAELRASGVLR